MRRACSVRLLAKGTTGSAMNRSDDLSRRVIEIQFVVGENSEKLELTWDEFFTEMARAHGNETLVSHDALVGRFQCLDEFDPF